MFLHLLCNLTLNFMLSSGVSINDDDDDVYTHFI